MPPPAGVASGCVGLPPLRWVAGPRVEESQLSEHRSFPHSRERPAAPALSILALL